MYKVFVSELSVFLGGVVKDINDVGEVHSIAPKEESSLKELIDQERDTGVLHVQGDAEALLEQLKKEYKYLEAAGGMVVDESGRVLMIHRRGFWDLPKGKAEPGETIEETALREVEEECNIKPGRIVREMTSTYHTYKEKGQDILKCSYWYEMTGDSSVDLVPQTEEDIEQVVWMTKDEVQQIADECYGSIQDVLREGGYL